MKGYLRMTDELGDCGIFSNKDFSEIKLDPEWNDDEKSLKKVDIVFSYINDYRGIVIVNVLSEEMIKEMKEKYGLNDDDIITFSQEVFDRLFENIISLRENELFDVDLFLMETLENLDYYVKEIK